jgi:hypothetical protein
VGFSVNGTVTYGKPLIGSLASLPAVSVAFFEASIDKAYLTWLDVSKLRTAFPENVKAMGDTVILQGPVMIVSSMSPARRLFMQCSLAIAATFISYIAYKFLLPATSRLKFSARSGPVEASSTHGRSAVVAVFALATGALAYYVAGRYLPTQAGVYFYNQTPFHA